MRSDDLVPILTGPPAGKAVTFRQGVIVTWNPTTAENTVLVGGTLLTNLAILNTSEAAILAEGDVVSILTAGPTWGILGRFTIPGTPEAASALSSLRTQSHTVSALEQITSATYVAASTNPGPEVTITVGKSGRLLVFASADISGQSTKAANNSIFPMGRMGVAVSGANTRPADDLDALTVQSNLLMNLAGTLGIGLAGTRVILLDSLNPGATTLTAMYRMPGNGTQINFSNRNITAMAI